MSMLKTFVKKREKNLQISENVGTKQSGFYLLHVLHVCESVVHAISRIGRGGRNLLAFACRILKICNRKFIPEMPYIFATIISNLDFQAGQIFAFTFKTNNTLLRNYKKKVFVQNRNNVVSKKNKFIKSITKM